MHRQWPTSYDRNAMRSTLPAPDVPNRHNFDRCFKYHVNLRALRDPTPHFFDSVGNSKIWCPRSYVNLQGSRHPTPHFPDSVGSSEHRPRLSPGNGATFAPKVPYFTVYFFAGSHRLRARAPDMRESSIGSAGPPPPESRCQSAR